ncbi:MAG: hypothetical protein HY721_09390 [Planctomycetes bacterium]|nr:hypothetical protein [Planctomycetota bacterium]
MIPRYLTIVLAASCFAFAAPTAWPQVTFEVGRATAAPAQLDVTVPVSIFVEEGTPPVDGWIVSLRYDPAALGNVRLESTRPADFITSSLGVDHYVHAGTVGMALVYDLDEPHSRSITSENDGEVARLHFCVLETAIQGTYPIRFAFHAEAVSSPASTTQYTAARSSRYPITRGGSVTVAGAPVAGAGCPADPPRPAPPSAETVIFQLGQATEAAGASEVAVPLEVIVEAGAPPVQGWAAAVHYGSAGVFPPPLGEVRIENARPADFFAFSGQSAFVDPGLVGAEVVYDLTRVIPENVITAETSGIVAWLRFCVLSTASSGSSVPLELVPFAERTDKPGIALHYTSEGKTRTPLTVPGSVTIAGDPVAGGACQPDEHEVPPPPPAELKAVLKIGGGSAFLGQEVRLPFTVLPNAEMQGFSVSVDFDETKLVGLEVEKVFSKPDGTDWDFQTFHIDNSDANPGSGGVDEGFLVAAAVFDFTAPNLGPRRDQESGILALRFQVKPAAPAGPTEVRFLDGGSAPSSPPTRNVAVLFGKTADVTYDVSPLFVNALLGIVGDITVFLRGDSNGDLDVDLSDAQATLTYLFVTGEPPHCLDAADANDDGTVDVTDPIFTLLYLFLGGRPLPPPSDSPGEDPTPDGMGCRG